jgi:hypothetical protein
MLNKQMPTLKKGGSLAWGVRAKTKVLYKLNKSKKKLRIVTEALQTE